MAEMLSLKVCPYYSNLYIFRQKTLTYNFNSVLPPILTTSSMDVDSLIEKTRNQMLETLKEISEAKEKNI